ncbi:MAG: RNA polymerase sigma factor [Nitrospinae bacterium]|nr:RNA polymerase sigma factor [Nitrospinota bacterium]
MENKKERFLNLFKEYESRIYNFIYRMTRNEADAEELTQEAFIRVWNGIDKLRSDSSITSWIYKIASNVCFDSFRKNKRTLKEETLEPDDEFLYDAKIPLIEDEIYKARMAECIRSYIAKLPEDYRAVILLHDIEGLKNSDIADMLGISLDAVKIKLHRARGRLRKILSKECQVLYDKNGDIYCEPKKGTKEKD